MWDTDGVRDDLRDYVTAHLDDSDAVLVVDETGDLKKGTRTVGVQRQYTGDRVENAQVAVYLAYAGARGHAMIDRELYLPRSWTIDPDRLDEAGVPEEIEFLTKPALATGMVLRALNAGVAARWVAGDEVYGADPVLRAELETQQIGYVLGIGCDRQILTAAGPIRADVLAATLPKRAWQRLSAGAGAKGERYYDWALLTLPGAAGQADPGDRQCWWLLVRRHHGTGELALIKQVKRARLRRSGTGTTTRAGYGCTAPGAPADCQRGSRRCPPKIEEPDKDDAGRRQREMDDVDTWLATDRVAPSERCGRRTVGLRDSIRNKSSARYTSARATSVRDSARNAEFARSRSNHVEAI